MTENPRTPFHFQIEVDGLCIGFSEISGLGQEIGVIEHREGVNADMPIGKIPGLNKFSTITLKRGIIPADPVLIDWLSGDEPKDLKIHLLNEHQEQVTSFKVKQAFPRKVISPGLKGSGNEMAVEALELAHEGILGESD